MMFKTDTDLFSSSNELVTGLQHEQNYSEDQAGIEA